MAVSYYEGRVHTVVYSDPVGAFYVLKVLLDEKEDPLLAEFPELAEPITVKGYIPGLQIQMNTWLGFEGKWIEHKKYGKQIEITRAPVLKHGWDVDTAEKMLAGNGVDSRIVRGIRKHFGDADFIAALGDAKQLQKVPGLAEFSAVHVSQRWAATRTFFQALDFMLDMKIPPGMSTLATSRTASTLSGKNTCSKVSTAVTAEKVRSSNGRALISTPSSLL